MNKNYKIGYVVLHYMALETTLECIESIKKVMCQGDHLIIVDNASPDNSGILLKQQFQNEKNVDVTCNQRNLGYAKGNNVGFLQLKKKFKTDFIILLNNDTIIEFAGWREKLIEIYEKTLFDVLGPKILDLRRKNSYCNPQIPIHIDYRKVKKGQISNYIKFFLSYINIDDKFAKVIDNYNRRETYFDTDFCENVQLSGCCLIFGPRYIAKFDGLNPGTFLYLEEQILYHRIYSEGMKSVYSAEMEIVHLEDISTMQALKCRGAKYRRRKYRFLSRSFKVLLKQMKDYAKKEKR